MVIKIQPPEETITVGDVARAGKEAAGFGGRFLFMFLVWTFATIFAILAFASVFGNSILVFIPFFGVPAIPIYRFVQRRKKLTEASEI